MLKPPNPRKKSRGPTVSSGSFSPDRLSLDTRWPSTSAKPYINPDHPNHKLKLAELVQVRLTSADLIPCRPEPTSPSTNHIWQLYVSQSWLPFGLPAAVQSQPCCHSAGIDWTANIWKWDGTASQWSSVADRQSLFQVSNLSVSLHDEIHDQLIENLLMWSVEMFPCTSLKAPVRLDIYLNF